MPVVRRRELPPPPDAASLQQALQTLEAAKQAQREPGEKLSAEPFSRAIRTAAARGEEKQAVDLLEKMKDDFELEPDAAAYHAVVEACEGREPLEHVWQILDEIR